MGLRDYVEPGRVCYVNFGEDYGKMCVIVDILDMNRVLVDGPAFPRVEYPLKRLFLTRLRLPLLRGARTGNLLKACKSFGLDAKWKATSAFKKMDQSNKRAATTDFDRFKVMIARKNRSYEVKKLAKKVKV